MPDDVARAVGAGGPTTITIAGKECTVRPLGIKELMEVERDCLDRFKRSYLETYSSNVDLLSAEERSGLMIRKLEEVSRWDIDSLPHKYAHDQVGVEMTAELKAWVCHHWDLEKEESDIRMRRMVAASLDQEVLTADEYKAMTKKNPPRVKVPYVHWWITGSYDGMVTMIWICFKHSGVTRNDVIESIGKDLMQLNELARDIEKLSAPSAGNG